MGHQNSCQTSLNLLLVIVGMMFYSLTYSFYNDDNDYNKMNLYCFLEIWLRRDLQ